MYVYTIHYVSDGYSIGYDNSEFLAMYGIRTRQNCNITITIVLCRSIQVKNAHTVILRSIKVDLLT